MLTLISLLAEEALIQLPYGTMSLYLATSAESTDLLILPHSLCPVTHFTLYPVWHDSMAYCISDRGPVINYGEGGYKMGKLWVQNFMGPPSRLFVPPLLKSGNFLYPPFNTSSIYHVKTTPKLVVPSFSMAKTFSAPPPFL